MNATGTLRTSRAVPNYPRKRKQNQRVAAVADPILGIPKLTVKQEKFAQGLLDGLSTREAYRRAYDCSGSSEATVIAESQKLSRNPQIATYIRAIQREGIQAIGITRESHLADLARLRELAVENTQISAGVQAEHYRGRVAGLYNDKLSLTVGPSDDALLSQLKAMLGPEIAQAIGEQLAGEPSPDAALLALPPPLDGSDLP